MTIKQQGGVFGRNPTFNDVDIQSDLNVNNGVLKVDAANNRVGVNTETPLAPLHMVGAEFRLQDVQYPYASWFVGSTRNAYMWSVNGARFEVVADQRPLVLSATGSNNVRLYANGLEQLTVGANNDVSVRNGNLVISTSGKGIDFSATPGTGTSELFDDYEEGTWTATVGCTGNATTTTTVTAYYTKIGRQVTVGFRNLNDIVTTGLSGFFTISLPFTANSGSTFGSAGSVLWNSLNYPAGVTQVHPIVSPSGTTMLFRFAGSGNAGALLGATVPTSGTSDIALLGVTYFTD